MPSSSMVAAPCSLFKLILLQGTPEVNKAAPGLLLCLEKQLRFKMTLVLLLLPSLKDFCFPVLFLSVCVRRVHMSIGPLSGVLYHFLFHSFAPTIPGTHWFSWLGKSQQLLNLSVLGLPAHMASWHGYWRWEHTGIYGAG